MILDDSRGSLVGADRRRARVAVKAGSERSGERLDLLGRVEVEPGALRLRAAVGGSCRVVRKSERRFPAAEAEDRADELTVLVDGAWRCAARIHIGEQPVDVARGDLGGGTVAKGAQDEPAVGLSTAAMGCTGLSQEVAVIAERRWLGAAHALDPV